MAMYLSYVKGSILDTSSDAYSSGYNDGYAQGVADRESELSYCNWNDGTDAEILSMVQAADAGRIDLTEYWSIGNERQVSLSAMAASGTNSYGSWSVNETHVAQTIVLVLMDTGIMELVTPVLDTNKTARNNCSFVVGVKNALANGTTLEGGYMNSTRSNTNSWNGCSRRAWCNTAFPAALPSTLISIFKPFKAGTLTQYNGTDFTWSEDLFAIFARREVTNETPSSYNATEWSNLTPVDWYKTVSNRVKTAGSSGSAISWWLRSPYSNATTYYRVYTDGATNYNGYANNTNGIAPFGCI